jgi:hypothetical protein
MAETQRDRSEAQPRFAEHNVLAVFPDMEAARSALLSLEQAGVEAARISLLGPQAEKAAEETDTADRDAGMAKDVTKAAAVGTAAGGAAGGIAGFLAGALAFGVPGIGPVVGAGIWAATLGGAAAGGSIGGLVGGTAVLPQSDAWELTYESVRAGRVIVGVHSERREDVQRAVGVLRRHEPLRLEQFDTKGGRLQAK